MTVLEMSTSLFSLKSFALFLLQSFDISQQQANKTIFKSNKKYHMEYSVAHLDYFYTVQETHQETEYLL